MAITDLDQLTFELERFEWRGDDRLEVTGRWYGLRGQRFMRPTLHLREGARRRRMIALLDHKPWAAEEDITWIAAFTYRGDHDGITAARLEVAPDITLELPLPGTAGPGTTLTPRPRRAEKARVEAEATAATAPPLATPEESPPAAEADLPPAPDDDLIARAGLEFAMLAMERELDEERSERARLSAELELARRRLETSAAHQASAVERANELVRVEGELAAALERADHGPGDEELAAALERTEAARAAAVARADDAIAALERAERARAAAEARADEATAALERPVMPAEPALEPPVRPLPRRVRPRSAGHRQWGLEMRLGVLAVVITLLVVLLVILT